MVEKLSNPGAHWVRSTVMSLFETLALQIYKDPEFQKPIRHFSLNKLQETPPPHLEKDKDATRFFRACVAAMRYNDMWISEMAEPLFGAVAELLDLHLTITQYDETEGRYRPTRYGDPTGTPLHLLRVQENRFTLVEACSPSPRS